MAVERVLCDHVAASSGHFLPEVRPGTCPRPTGVGICVERCSNDFSCSPGEKCCSNGCGHVCTKVLGVRPGRCPRTTGRGICVELCSNDFSCGPGEKCCGTGCGHICKKALRGSR
ncbi:WAP four-disulfide core domain protein 3-like isoform X2 [Rhineura floridana]|uniref:WAP four-disulfide core domain protein 3-like isoform X2 n=1 Tax=Rhineura floridana TaxID=261503 RepID=UPI002AC88E3A|nr:WAP four-disulfide core domain protein 3-like isoform X2 [Rhineura floridana]